jgi:S-layer family protein
MACRLLFLAFALGGVLEATAAGAAVVPSALAVDPDGNGVYQPNEIAVVAPTWINWGSHSFSLTGTFTIHSGPPGPAYSIPDPSGNYGAIPPGSSASCLNTNNCYSVANTTASRPAGHWDTTVVETVNDPTPTAKTWTLHVGDSFSDVAPSSPFYRFIETLLHRGVTIGCTATTYCPGSSTTREQLAVFVLMSKEGLSYSPPPCVTGSERFGDVPAIRPFCRWIEELTNRGVVSGCGGGNYCPVTAVTREQMGVFLAVTFGLTLYGL